MTQTKPDCIIHWREIEETTDSTYAGDDEALARQARFGRHFGFSRLGINHERVLPGRRTSFPHAESTEEEFVYVISGTPDVWLDGVLHRLAPGDGVGFPPGTGQAHTFINNTEEEVQLLVVGDTNRADNRIVYPMHPERRAMRDDWWDDAPPRAMGPHDGMPDKVREAKRKR